VFISKLGFWILKDGECEMPRGLLLPPNIMLPRFGD
jgi:hypothetical protein